MALGSVSLGQSGLLFLHRFGAPLVDLALRSWALGGDPAQRDRLEQQMAGEIAADKVAAGEIAGEIAAGEGAPAAAAAPVAAAATASAALGGWGYGATGWSRVPDAAMVWTDWLLVSFRLP